MFDIGYYIFHNCKRKNCPNFPKYNREVGRYYSEINNDKDYDCLFCEDCQTYKRALENTK